MIIADPLLRNITEQQRLLHTEFQRLAANKNVDAVIGAAINILVNAIRQQEPFRAGAEARWTMFMGRGGTILLDHYDSVTGRRRTIFPFTQQVVMPIHHEDDEARG